MSRKKKAPQRWQNAIVRYADEAPESLLANPQNWRLHPREQTAALVGSLNEVGWIAPVIVNETTQHIVDGHARIGEAIARGEPTVPVAYVRLSEAQERLALATFDPIAAMATTDQAMLDGLLAGLSTSQDGLDELLRSLASEQPKPLNDDDADLTPPVEPITKPGDLWLLGDHRLLCGDATKAEDVAGLMGNETAGIVLTDPPYGMDLDTDFSTIHGSLRSIGATHGTRGNTYDRVTGDDHAFDPVPICEAFRECREMFLFGADYYAERIPDRIAGSWLVWDKRKESQAEAIGAEFELIWSKQQHKRRMLRHDWFGFLSSENTAEARDRVHPTQKPTSLLRDILNQWAPLGLPVADPYLGSGSTLIACEQTQRRCYGLEIEPSWVDVAVRRWEHVTGRKAERVGATVPDLVTA